MNKISDSKTKVPKKSASQRSVRDFERFRFEDHKDYIWLFIITQLSTYHMRNFTNGVLNSGGLNFVVLFSAMYAVIGIPLTFSQLVLGLYTQVGYLEVWKISPILNGMGYSMTLLYICRISKAIMSSSRSMTYMMNTFASAPPYKYCPGNTVPGECDDLTKGYVKNVTCCTMITIDAGNCPQNDTRLYYPAYYYFRTHIDISTEAYIWNGLGFSKIPPTIVFVILSWLIVFLLSRNGLHSLKKGFTKGIAVFFIITLLLFIFFLSVYSNIKEKFIEFFTLQAPTRNTLLILIIETYIGVIETSDIATGVIISLGSYFPYDTVPERDILTVFFFKYFMLLLFGLIICLCIIAIAEYHKINVHCLTIIQGFGIMYSSIPEYYSTIPTGQILLNLCYFGSFLGTAIIFLAALICFLVDGMLDLFPDIQSSRNYITGATCFVFALFQLLFYTKSKSLIFNVLHGIAYPLSSSIMTVLYSIVMFWIYGVERFSDDIHFMTGHQLSAFWRCAWHITVIVTLIFTPAAIYVKLVYDIKTNDQMHAGIILTIFFLAPIFLAFLYQCYQALKAHDIFSILKTSKKWGPPTQDLRDARMQFNPRYSIQHRTKYFTCTHNCLLGNKQFQNLIKLTDENRKSFQTKAADI